MTANMLEAYYCRVCDSLAQFDGLAGDWYDGYIVENTPEDLHIYNSNSVVSSLLENKLENYWPKTESYEDLKQYIQTDIGGLHDVLIKLIGGKEYDLKTESFSNDIVTTDKLSSSFDFFRQNRLKSG